MHSAAFAALIVCSTALSVAAAQGTPVARAAVVCLLSASLAHLALVLRSRSSRHDVVIVVMTALACHIALLVTPLLYSDDAWRYLVDGTLSAAGINPFAYPPDSPKIAALIGELSERVNHPHMPTIYPPGAQAAFAANAVFGATLLGWKLIAFAALCAGALVLNRLPADGRLPKGAALFCHPLALIAVSGNANVDALGIPVVCALIVLMHGHRSLRSASRRHDAPPVTTDGMAAALIGAAASIKLFPLALVAALAGRRKLGRTIVVSMAAAALLCLSYLPLAGAGAKMFGSLGTYVEIWRYNDGAGALAHTATERALTAAGVAESLEVPLLSRLNEARGVTTVYNGEATHKAFRSRQELAALAPKALTILALIAAFISIRRRRLSLAHAACLVLLAFWLFAPVIHPWYLLWLLPFALAADHRTSLVWCATIALAFYTPAAVADGLPWTDSAAIRLAEYLPVWFTLGAGLVMRPGGRSRPVPA